MKLENTNISNYQLVIDESNIPVAVRINGEVKYQLYDLVRVTADCRGYICPEIKNEGFGKIVKIRNDDTDYFFGVLMDNGEFGFMKSARIERVYSRKM